MLPKVSGLVKANTVLSDTQKEAISRMPLFTELNTITSSHQSIKSLECQKTDGVPSFDEDKLPIRLLSIDKILRSPFQNRTVIDESYVNDLAENIKADGCNQPIMVRPMGNDQQYELIAGEHRYEAFKLLNLKNIPAIVRELDDQQAARSLLYDNIFHKKLHDFEVFKGFKKLLELDHSLSLRGIAKDTGLSFSQVQRIMSFGKLPKQAIDILNINPEIIGANVAETLARHTTVGYENYVIEVLRLIQAHKLSQMRANAWIQSRVNPKLQKSPRILSDKYGNHYCTMTKGDSYLNLKFSSDVDITAIEEMIYKTLKEQNQVNITD